MTIKALALASAAAIALASFATTASATCYYCGGEDGSTGASFEGSVFSTNLAGSAGGIGGTFTSNWKVEEGMAASVQDTDGPDGAIASALVATGGNGMAWNMNFGGGTLQSESIVQGTMSGDVLTSAFED